jgi:hypothetical protein
MLEKCCGIVERCNGLLHAVQRRSKVVAFARAATLRLDYVSAWNSFVIGLICKAADQYLHNK